MRRLALAVVMLAVSGAVSGCVIGPGPVAPGGPVEPENQRLNENFTKELERPTDVRDAAEFVTRYLKAAADKPETRLDTLRGYMKDKVWTPGEDINVYRVFNPELPGQSNNIIPVTVPMQKIGVLTTDGRIEPVFGGRVEMEFKVVEVADGYLLQDAPPELIMDDEMLDKGYEPRPLYFWDKEDRRLVPDLRYIPRYMLPGEKAKKLVDYLYRPPSLWLGQAVKPAAGQLPRNDPVYTSDGNISIDLRNQLAEEELARLSMQLERMLVGQNGVDGVEIKIQGVRVEPGRIPPPEENRLASRFAVQQGKVVRLDFGPDRGVAGVPLTAAVNANVEWALFSRREESVALSQREGNVQRFLIGRSSTPKQVTVNGNKPVDQAAWLEGGSDAALVLSNRTLYEVVPGPADVQPKVTQLAGTLPGPVTSFSVVPDGRVALVIDKKLYMAALYRNGRVLSVTLPQQIPTALDQVQHVALMRIDAVIAGVGVEQKQSKLVLTRINVDGAIQAASWKDYQASEQISRLVADFRLGAQAAYYDYNGAAFQLGTGGASPVRDSQVVKAEPSPSPSASATSPPAPPISAASFEG